MDKDTPNSNYRQKQVQVRLNLPDLTTTDDVCHVFHNLIQPNLDQLPKAVRLFEDYFSDLLADASRLPKTREFLRWYIRASDHKTSLKYGRADIVLEWFLAKDGNIQDFEKAYCLWKDFGVLFAYTLQNPDRCEQVAIKWKEAVNKVDPVDHATVAKYALFYYDQLTQIYRPNPKTSKVLK